MPEQRRGLIFGFLAYGIWGLLPLYWPLLEPAGSLEILAHRFVWSLGIVALLLLIRPRRGWWTALRARPKALACLVVAAALIAGNWGIYIWGVVHHHVVETSLGYFINPLVTVIFGVVFFRERLRPAQWTAIGTATVAVLVLGVGYGQVPWIAFGLALTFASYGVLKKKAATGAVEGLAVETTVVTPFALGYLLWLQYAGTAAFGQHGPDHNLLLVGAGLATAVPLLLFAGAANRISLTLIGILQYLAPSLQFAIGVLVFNEPMPPERLAGFVIVWIALVVFTAEGLLARRHRQLAARRDIALTAGGGPGSAH